MHFCNTCYGAIIYKTCVTYIYIYIYSMVLNHGRVHRNSSGPGVTVSTRCSTVRSCRGCEIPSVFFSGPATLL